MRPRMISDESPPAVTMPRKTLSDSRGSVVITRRVGIAGPAEGFSVIATPEYW
ncbi:MAG: hypothetical protein RLZZ131_272 [Actinomycetota bacterium]